MAEFTLNSTNDIKVRWFKIQTLTFIVNSNVFCYDVLSASTRTRAYARGVGVKTPLELHILQNFITCAKEINCFRILFAC